MSRSPRPPLPHGMAGGRDDFEIVRGADGEIAINPFEDLSDIENHPDMIYRQNATRRVEGPRR